MVRELRHDFQAEAILDVSSLISQKVKRNTKSELKLEPPYMSPGSRTNFDLGSCRKRQSS